MVLDIQIPYSNRILLNVGCLVLLTIVLVHVIQRHEQELHSSRASRGVASDHTYRLQKNQQ